MRKKSWAVAFVVKYEDGKKHHIVIEHDALRDGDQAVTGIAEQHQKLGRIPAGKIVAIQRLRPAD